MVRMEPKLSNIKNRTFFPWILDEKGIPFVVNKPFFSQYQLYRWVIAIKGGNETETSWHDVGFVTVKDFGDYIDFDQWGDRVNIKIF